MDILINKDTTAIVKKAVLKNLPDFIIITGENGTGKSQFLTYLYLQVTDLLGNPEEMMMDGMREIYIDRGEFTYNENGEVYTPNVQILDGEKVLDKITCRTTYPMYFSMGDSLNVFHLLSLGKQFAHKFIFYASLKNGHNKNAYINLEDIDALNKSYLQEIGFSYNNTSNLPSSFTLNDKILAELIIRNHEDVKHDLLCYYYIAYLPIQNTNVFAVNIGSLILQHWAKQKIGIKVKESPIEIFNQIAIAAKFRYTLQNPIITENTDALSLQMLDRTTEITVSINHLSSGEKVILSLVSAIYSSNIDTEFPDVILFDEPDAYLHPSLSKYMLDVLQNVFVKDKGIKIIMSTHSPSTVALAPEESLYKMDRSLGYITKTNQREAVDLLSDGFLTFEEGIETFNLLKKSTKNTVVCVEGKTDIAHIQTAMQKLGRNLDIDLVDLHDSTSLASFIKSIPASILAGKKIIGLFDNDIAGRTDYGKIKGEEQSGYKVLTSEQSKGQAFAACLPPSDSILEHYCPIEYLYSKETLEKYDMIELRNFHDFKQLYKATIKTAAEDSELNNEFDRASTLRVYKVQDDNKNKFSAAVKELEQDAFWGFNPLLDLLEEISKKNSLG